jgi:hypothetical protein
VLRHSSVASGDHFNNISDGSQVSAAFDCMQFPFLMLKMQDIDERNLKYDASV